MSVATQAKIRLLNKDKQISRYRHAYIISRLIMYIGIYVETLDSGWVIDDPDIQLPNLNIKIRPDIAYISEANQAIIRRIIEGVPDLVVESLSPASYLEDSETKFQIYEQAGIPEYWIVSPELRTLHVYTLRNGKYELLCHAVRTGLITSEVLPGLEIDLEKLFRKMI